MNIPQLVELLEICKLLKSDVIVTRDNIIMGADKNFIYFKEMKVDTILPHIAINMLDIQNQLKQGINIESINIFNPKIYNKICSAFWRLNNIQYNNTISYINIQNDDDFKDAFTLKTSQGIQYIRRGNRFIIPIYNGLLPILKSDNIDLILYDIDNYKFLCKFIIHKKKNMTVDTYVLCKHLI